MEKKKYIIPTVEIIWLDNEISLALQSTPPVGPGESNLKSDVQPDDPYKTYLV